MDILNYVLLRVFMFEQRVFGIQRVMREDSIEKHFVKNRDDRRLSFRLKLTSTTDTRLKINSKST